MNEKAKAFIREKMRAVRPGMSGDERLSLLYGIYDALEATGCTKQEVKGLIDEVIYGNVIRLKYRLNEHTIRARAI